MNPPVDIRQVRAGDGARLVYALAGAAAAPPLVLLHGWGQSHRSWGDDVLTALAGRFRVIAPDLRGHGYSEPGDGGWADPETWAGDLDAVLADAGVDRPVVLVGWSYGGLVGADFLASRGADRIAGLVLVGAITGIGRGVRGGRVGPGMRAALPGALSERPSEAISALGGFGAAMVPPGRGDGVRQQLVFGQSLSTPPAVRAGLFLREIDHDADLAAFERPVLLIHGTEDGVVDMAAARHTEGILPDARCSWWEGAGHAPFLEDPARFVAEITGFVDSLADPGAAEG